MGNTFRRVWDFCFGASFFLPTKFFLTASFFLPVGLFGLLYKCQRRLIFPAPAIAHPAVGDKEKARIERGHNFVGLYIPPPSQNAPVVVFWHGNADQVGWGSAYFGHMLHHHLDVGFFGVEFPGYGIFRDKNGPSAKSITASSVEALKHLTTTLRIDASRLILVGQSIGCNAALELALCGYAGRGMVLISPFTSIADMVRRFISARFVDGLLRIAPWVIQDPMDNMQNAQNLKQIPGFKRESVFVVHGNLDEIVPYSHGEKLATVLGARLITIPGGHHNDMMSISNLETLISVIRRLI